MSWMTTARCPFFERRFTFPWRLLFYLIPWLGAAVAIWICCGPESPNETDLSPLQQALALPFWAPLLAILGIGYLVFGEDGGLLAGGLVALVFLTHAGFALSRRSVAALMGLFVLQVILAGIGVGGLVHLSRLPSGG